MSWTDGVWRVRSWLRLVGRRATVHHEVEEELLSHIAHRADDLERAGQSHDEALRSARVEFGGVSAYAEATFEARQPRLVTLIESVAMDARYALRTVRRAPIVTTICILSLAIGIGANTLVFSVVNALWFRPLPIRDPASLVTLTLDPRLPGMDYPTVVALRAHREIVSDLAGIGLTERSNISLGGIANSEDPRPANVQLVTGNYFAVMGISASRGRTIEPSDDTDPGAHPVVVISDGYWRRRFGGDPNVVGRSIAFNGTTYTVIGVAPATFSGDVIGTPAALWIPISMQSEVMVERPGLLTNPNPPWVRMVARLAPGVTREAAMHRASIIYQQMLTSRLGGSTTPQQALEVSQRVMRVFPAGHGYTADAESLSQPAVLLWIIVGVVLVLACVNVAGLLLSRAFTREREIATRAAIGAGRARVVRQLATEGFIIAAFGGVLGIFTAAMSLRSLSAAIYSARGIALNLTLDPRTLVVAACVAMVVSLVAGLAPAIVATRTSLVRSLMARPASWVRGTLNLRRPSTSQFLVVGQVALSLALVTSAGLFTRSLVALRQRDTGFDRRNTVLAWTAPMQAGVTKDRLANVYDATISSVGALPGVIEVAGSSRGMLGDVLAGSPIRVPDYVPRPDDDATVAWNLVTPTFFRAAGIPILAGRAFDAADLGAPRAAIISRSLAMHYFGSANPIGRHFGLRRGTDYPLEVVGVVGDAVDNSMHRVTGTDLVYLPYRQDLAHLTNLCLVVRTSRASEAFLEEIRRAIRTAAPSLPVLSVLSMDEQIARSLTEDLLIAAFCGAFGGLALILAVIGLYGAVAQSVAIRRREFAVRLALGASPRLVATQILRETLTIVAAGMVLGVAVVVVASHQLMSRLFGLSPIDPVSIGGAATVMVLTGVVAAALPARRAAATDPFAALREG